MKINHLPQHVAMTDTASTKAENLKREKDLKAACEGFEAIFLNSMMKSMRDTLPGDSLFPQSNASDIFQSLHDQYMTEEISQGKESMGLKEFLYDQLKDRI
ncbi:MAG TPA: flagellar biosynthesis protein FlgJ [Desulfobacteraceae bacterium]|nr:flagellar biosynthesis protein FlgJ [Desulfobacteraceae bacterium]|tara:strand:- start:205 stop:507 length:303 start_codon:yes stop_codon:yes gene_type:complete